MSNEPALMTRLRNNQAGLPRRTIIASLSVILLAAGACSPHEGNTPAPATSTEVEVIGAPSDEFVPRARPSSAPSPELNVTIDDPPSGHRITTNPLTVRGTARTFENHVSLRVLDESGNLMVQSHATATGDVGNFNPWEKEILLTAMPGKQITIEAFETSPRDGSVRSLTTATYPFDVPPKGVDLYFHDPDRAPNDCSRVYPVRRNVPASLSLARLIVDALIQGPSGQWSKLSPFPETTELESIRIEDGVAILDFDESLQNVGGSCRVRAIRAMLERSLTALPGVDRIIIRAGGSEERALQP